MKKSHIIAIIMAIFMPVLFALTTKEAQMVNNSSPALQNAQLGTVVKNADDYALYTAAGSNLVLGMVATAPVSNAEYASIAGLASNANFSTLAAQASNAQYATWSMSNSNSIWADGAGTFGGELPEYFTNYTNFYGVPNVTGLYGASGLDLVSGGNFYLGTNTSDVLQIGSTNVSGMLWFNSFSAPTADKVELYSTSDLTLNATDILKLEAGDKISAFNSIEMSDYSISNVSVIDGGSGGLTIDAGSLGLWSPAAIVVHTNINMTGFGLQNCESVNFSSSLTLGQHYGAGGIILGGGNVDIGAGGNVYVQTNSSGGQVYLSTTGNTIYMNGQVRFESGSEVLSYTNFNMNGNSILSVSNITFTSSGFLSNVQTVYGIFKRGTNQSDASALSNEIWVDTDDDYTLKLGN